jgi:hypothetical protein
MTRPSQQFLGLNCRLHSRGWRQLPRLVLTSMAMLALLGSAACSGGNDANDTGSGANAEGDADADGKLTDTKKDADVEGTDIVDATDDVPDVIPTDATPDVQDVDAATDGVGTELPDGTDDGDTFLQPDEDIGDSVDAKLDIEVVVNKCDLPPSPLTGTFGWPCKDGGECDSGYCIDTPDGKICTQDCTNNCCPGGWGCKNISVASDPWYGCVPNLVHTCDPCTDDLQCQSSGDPAGLCLTYGDVGNFCGGTCVVDADCPTSYYCLKGAKGTKNGVSGTGGTGNQCMKKSGQCECSMAAKATGATTNCQSTNKYGKCGGTRQCQPGGLTGCDAKAPTAEVCNGLDDNCDGTTDEAGASLCTTYWLDGDKDGFGNSPATGGDNQCLCKPVDLYTSQSPSDCNDSEPAIKPSAAEICDGIDNDCNGKTDETCDEDKDGYCDATAVIVGKTKACKYVGADCDDGNPKIHPGQPEICGNNIDDDCDGQTDSGATDAVGCNLFYEDGDKDGVGTFNSQCLCAPGGIFTATTSGDCNDSNKNVFPGNKEVCGNGIDDNCNGKQDEAGALNCSNFYKDSDADGFGDSSPGVKPACLCAPSATYTTAKGGDCNDSDAKMNPAMTEVCNNIDDDCDGQTDNNNALGCSTFYADYDKDGFGDSKKALCLCAAVDKWTATIGGDCNDTAGLIPGTSVAGSAVNPVAKESCNAVDDDCNGIVDDPGAQGCAMAYKDADGDSYGDTATKACICGLAMPYNTFKDGDCDDKLALVHPQAAEKCNGIDDNCNNVVDEQNAEGCTVYYADSDNDGVGNTAKAACFCAKSGIYSSSKGGDCNDSDPAIKPGNPETCDGKDNDCDGTIDNQGAINCVTYYSDSDKDGYGDVKTLPKCLCAGLNSWTVQIAGDCNDGNDSIHPGVPEKCDGVDNDCDGTVDPPNATGCQNYYPDVDNDGYGDMYASNWACQCGPLYPNTSPQSQAKDCNDKNPLVSPGSFEVCGDFIDNNCNGLTDEPVTNTLFFIDVDGDGYGTGPGQSLCKPGIVNGQNFSASQAGDCNDALKDVHPNATEICNAIDDDCNGKTDEQLPSVMCGATANGDPACIKGKCVPQCYASWFDADGIASDGCECKADNFNGIVGDSCVAPVEFGYLYDDGAVQIIKSGNIMPGEAGDWFHFKAVDSNDASQSCDPFNVHVWLSGNPDGKFTVDLYKHSCGSTALLCGNETDTGWTVSYSGKSPYGPQTTKGAAAGITQPSPIPEMGGECKCVNGVSLPGMNQCTDNSDDFYVRVGRYPGSGTICQNYTLTITNGN